MAPCVAKLLISITWISVTRGVISLPGLPFPNQPSHIRIRKKKGVYLFLAAKKKKVLHFYYSFVCALPISGADSVQMGLVRLSDLGLSSVEEGYLASFCWEPAVPIGW